MVSAPELPLMVRFCVLVPASICVPVVSATVTVSTSTTDERPTVPPPVIESVSLPALASIVTPTMVAEVTRTVSAASPVTIEVELVPTVTSTASSLPEKSRFSKLRMSPLPETWSASTSVRLTVAGETPLVPVKTSVSAPEPPSRVLAASKVRLMLADSSPPSRLTESPAVRLPLTVSVPSPIRTVSAPVPSVTASADAPIVTVFVPAVRVMLCPPSPVAAVML